MSKPILTIVIPTFNRPKLLSIAIDSILAQKSANAIEIVVVDNHPKSTAKTIVKKYRNPNIRYTIEKTIGHSAAKNKGLSLAKGNYIMFLDDDARLPQNWFQAFNKHLKKQAVIFGGPIMPYYNHQKPSWFKSTYEMRGYGQADRWLELLQEFLPTSSTIINTQTLRAIGGFNEKYGIVGTKRSFGEDTDVLRKVQRTFPKSAIWYSPDLSVEHFTPPAKTIVAYMFKHHFNLGRSEIAVSGVHTNLIKALVKAFSALVLMLIKFLAIFLRNRKKYPFPQNYLYEIVAPKMYWFGVLVGRMGI